MRLEKKIVKTKGIRLMFIEDTEIARAYLYFIRNDLHRRQYGLMEDVFVGERFRRNGVGKEIVLELMSEAYRQDCYKILCGVQNPYAEKLYESIGFCRNGSELRLNL